MSGRFDPGAGRPPLAGAVGRRGLLRAPTATAASPRPMCWRCSPIRRGASTWAMCATTRWATSSPASAGCRVMKCFIRWAGTRSGCRPRMRRWSASVHPGGMDLGEYRGDARAAEADRLRDRLEPRARDLRSRLLRPRAGAVPRPVRRRPRLPQGERGQLGPGRHDRARQRAGDRRPRLALGRGGRAAQAFAMVPEDHRFRRRSARGARRGSTNGRRRSG